VSFPIYLRIGALRIHPHFFFETTAYVVASVLLIQMRKRNGDLFSADFRWWVIAAAAVGAALGCRLLAWLEASSMPWDEGGKTIVGGLIGGLIAVELVKKRFGVTSATGDLFAIPLAVGIAVGRVGCFLTGLADETYGIPTGLRWGVNFGDGVPRHPTQLYEIVFLVVLAVLLVAFSRRPHVQGDVFKLFMTAYLGWRFLIDFLKPAHRVFGVSAIQIACLLTLTYYARHFVRIGKLMGRRRVLAES
jgi:prolipoprotein diacylglyceryltransferase